MEPTTTPLSDDERAELATLRAEIAALRSRTARSRHGLVRTALSVLLLALGSLLAPAAVTAVWLDRQMSDTDRYVATVAPLAEDPAVQRAVTDRITTAVFAHLDIAGLADQAADALTRQGATVVGTALNGLADPIENGVQSWGHDQIARLVASDQFAQIWTQANRAAHAQLVAALTGDRTGALVVEGDTVSIRLQPFVEAVKQRLVAEGFELAARIPAVDAQFTILQSPDVLHAQNYFRLIGTLGTWLPIVSAVLLIGGILVAGRRRRAVIGAALGVAAGMALLGIALAVARTTYLNALPAATARDAATVVFDTLVRFLRTGLRTALAGALLAAAVAYGAGPAPAAVGFRRLIGRGVGAVQSGAWRLGLRTGPVGPWIARHKRWLQALVGAATVLVLVFWNYPSVRVVLAIALIALAMLLLIELLGGRIRPPARSEGPLSRSEGEVTP